MKGSKAKIIINVVTLAGLALLILFSREQIGEAFNELKDLSVGFLLLLIPLQILYFIAVARMYYSYFQATNSLENLTIKDMYRVSLELNFVNHVFPSGGVSGFSFLGYRLQRYGIPVASSTLAQVVRYFLTFLSFLILLAVGSVFLALGHQVNGIVILVSSAVFFITVFGTLTVTYLISDEKRIQAFTSFLPRAINQIVSKLGIHKKGDDIINVARVERVFSELHKDYEYIKTDYRKLKMPFIYGLLTNIFEVATIYVVYLAFGEAVNPGAVILAYAVANFAGLVAILPGGVGIYEALMVYVAGASGIPRGLAISATLVFRVLKLLVLVPIGGVLYYTALNKKRTKDNEPD